MSRRRLTKAEAAEQLGISPKQLERYVAEGIPCSGTGASRRFPWPEIRAWRDKLLVKQGKAKAEQEKPPARRDDIGKALDRKALAEAQLLEIKLAEAEGRLIPMEMHERRYAAACDRLRAVLMTIPSKYLGRIQQARSDAEAHAVGESIRDETLRALLETADDVDDADVDSGPAAA